MNTGIYFIKTGDDQDPGDVLQPRGDRAGPHLQVPLQGRCPTRG